MSRQDIALFHISVIATININKLKLELFAQPPYSPDLPPEFSFPELEKWLGVRKFTNSNEMGAAVDGYFEVLVASHYEQCIKAKSLRQLYRVNGDHDEK